MTRMSLARATRKAREQAQKDRERSLARLRRRSGDDAATERQLQEHAAEWAKRTHGEHARGRHVVCACGAEFLSLVGLDDEPMVKQCSTCTKGATT